MSLSDRDTSVINPDTLWSYRLVTESHSITSKFEEYQSLRV